MTFIDLSCYFCYIKDAMRTYRTGQFARLVHCTPRTVVRWDLTGKFKAHRNAISHQRYYTPQQVDQVLGITPTKKQGEQKIYIYARVSSYGQKNDLKRQIKFLKQYAYGHGYQIQGVIYDIGSGMNYKRKNWNKLIKLVLQHKRIKVITYKPDSFVADHLKWFRDLFDYMDSKLIVIDKS